MDSPPHPSPPRHRQQQHGVCTLRRDVRFWLLFLGLVSVTISVSFHTFWIESPNLVLLAKETSHDAWRLEQFAQGRPNVQLPNSSDLSPRLSGKLDVDLNHSSHCLSVEIRGQEASLTVEDAIDWIQKHGHGQPLQIGLIFREDPDQFLSLANGVMHLFHFLEFLVVAYPQMQQLEAQVAWIYVPLLTTSEICGAAGGINCLILRLFFPHAWVYGLEANDNATMSLHPAFAGVDRHRSNHNDGFWTPLPKEQQNHQHEAMLDRADATLVVDRMSCEREQYKSINKIWTNYMDDFPVDAWHQQVSDGIGTSPSNNARKPLVCYIDRQNTSSPNRRLPPLFHDWLVEFLSRHSGIDFLHLHMEDYSALDQLRIAAECDVLIGAHGNGLSHLLWMKPRRYVVEMYYNSPVQYDYATAARLMQHQYLGLHNGAVIDPDRLQDLDLPHYETNLADDTVCDRLMDEGRSALEGFLEKAIQELQIQDL